MHLISLLFFLVALALAFGVIHKMLAGHADVIIAALRGEQGVRDHSARIITFAGRNQPPCSAVNDNVSLPVAA
jgi:ABC-type nickel/cobalt efflux system permease component RcnA